MEVYAVLLEYLQANHSKDCLVSQDFSFDLQQVVDSDMVCADGVCFIPSHDVNTVPDSTHVEQQRD